jgi:hypothetical protein
VKQRTRIEPDLILTEEEYGRTPEETHADFPTLSIDTTLKVRAFAHRHQLVAVKALKVLLDENVPHTLRHYLAHHDTMTAAYAGLAGQKNGALLDAAEADAKGLKSPIGSVVVSCYV